MEIINAPLVDFIDDLPLLATTADSVLQLLQWKSKVFLFHRQSTPCAKLSEV